MNQRDHRLSGNYSFLCHKNGSDDYDVHASARERPELINDVYYSVDRSVVVHDHEQLQHSRYWFLFSCCLLGPYPLFVFQILEITFRS